MKQDDRKSLLSGRAPKLSPIAATPARVSQSLRYLRVLLGEGEPHRSRPRCAEDNLDRYQADDAARPFAYRHFPLTSLVTGFFFGA